MDFLSPEKPPCKNCQKAMARWAKKNNGNVVYKYTGEKGAKDIKGKPGIFTASADKSKPGGVAVDHKSQNAKAGAPLAGKSEAEMRKSFDSIDPNKGQWSNVPPKVSTDDLNVPHGQHPSDW